MPALSRIAIVLIIIAFGRVACWSSTPRGSEQKDAIQAQGASSARPTQDPKSIFAAGEAALASGDLDQAERSFKRVLSIDSRAAAAYANLGVVHMRRRQWEPALANLHQAEKLAPQMPGVQLDIGLVHYRQNDFRHAIPAFESAVKAMPDSLQARLLLGQCYFFTDRYVEAVDMLEPLWMQQSKDLNYLFVLGIAADKAERKDLGDRALARLVEVGGDLPEVHLLIGKAMLNLEAYDDAARELVMAAEANPKLPFVHFELGLLYSKKGDYERAKTEFLEDIAIEPDVVFNYDELGNVYFLMDKDTEAEKSYQQALRLQPHMLNPHLGLAKVYQRRAQYEKALSELEAAGRIDPGSSRIHYLRGQVLLRMGRKAEGKKEIDTSVAMSSARREKRQKELEEREPAPTPELTQETK